MCRGCAVYDVHASQLSCLGTCTCTCSSAGRALCLQCGVSWLRILPGHEAAHFSLEKLLSWMLCLVCLTVLACLLLSSFLLHLSNMYMSLTHTGLLETTTSWDPGPAHPLPPLQPLARHSSTSMPTRWPGGSTTTIRLETTLTR